MSETPRDIDSFTALERLNALYNDLALVGSVYSPEQAKDYREAVLHCIAALHCVRQEREGQVLRFRPRR